MNIRQLQIFWAIMRTGSVTGAGRLLGISQPAVSKILKHTEQVIGMPLFIRRRGKLIATPEAEHLFILTDMTFVNIETIKQAVLDFRHGMTGRILIVAVPTLGASVMPEAFSRFLRLHPNIELSLKLLPTVQVISRVALQQADIGLIYGPLNDISLHGEILYDGSIVCAVHVDNPLAQRDYVNLEDLRSERIISFQRTTSWGATVQASLDEAVAPLHISVECSHANMVFALVDAGVGTGVMVRVPGLRESFPNVVIKSLRPRMALDPLVIYRRTQPLSRLSLALLDTIRETVADFPANAP